MSDYQQNGDKPSQGGIVGDQYDETIIHKVCIFISSLLTWYRRSRLFVMLHI